MQRHARAAATAAVALLLIAAAASELRWDYADPFSSDLPSIHTGEDVAGAAVVAMVDDATFDATVEAYGLRSLERPDFAEHVLVYVKMVYGSCPPSPETVTLEEGAVLIRLHAIDPDAACPQAGAISHGVVRLWRSDLPPGEVPVRVLESDGQVRIEGTIPNGPTLPNTGAGRLPYAGAGLLLAGLGTVILRTTAREVGHGAHP